VISCLAQAHLQLSVLITSTSITLTLHSHPQLPITSLVYIVNGSAYKDRKSATPDSNAKRPKTRFCGSNPFPSLPVAHASSAHILWCSRRFLHRDRGRHLCSASMKLMENPKWKDFLGRQQATIQRAQARSMSAPPGRGLILDAEREAEFLQRQKEVSNLGGFLVVVVHPVCPSAPE
jgi:hypothetical protein